MQNQGLLLPLCGSMHPGALNSYVKVNCTQQLPNVNQNVAATVFQPMCNCIKKNLCFVLCNKSC
jgi:hypothetical protein